MSALERAVAAVRPGVALRTLSVSDDEVVLAGGGEVFRLPLAPSAVARHALLVRALPRLRERLPVTVAAPRYVGLLGENPFVAEPLVAGAAVRDLSPVGVGQLAGVLAALADVPPREAASWGATGEGSLLHGALDAGALLADPARGLLTGVVGWRPRLGDPADDLAALPQALRDLLP